MKKKFVILDETFPPKGSIDEDIKWICKVLGFSGKRDKSGLPWKILKVILKRREVDEGELAEMLKVSRTAISHHVEKMVMAGIVSKSRGRYFLAANSLEEALIEMEMEISKALEKIRRISREIDRRFKMRGRV